MRCGVGSPSVTTPLRLCPPTPTYKAARPSVGVVTQVRGSAARHSATAPPAAAARPLHRTAPHTSLCFAAAAGRSDQTAQPAAHTQAPARVHAFPSRPAHRTGPNRAARTGGPGQRRPGHHRLSFCPNATAASGGGVSLSTPYKETTPNPPYPISPLLSFLPSAHKNISPPPPDCYCRCLLALSACLRSSPTFRSLLLRLGFPPPPPPPDPRQMPPAAAMALPTQAPSNSGTHARARSGQLRRPAVFSLSISVRVSRLLPAEPRGADDASLCSGRGSAVPGALARLRRPARHRPPRRRPRLLLPPGTHRAGKPPPPPALPLLPLELSLLSMLRALILGAGGLSGGGVHEPGRREPDAPLRSALQAALPRAQRRAQGSLLSPPCFFYPPPVFSLPIPHLACPLPLRRAIPGQLLTRSPGFGRRRRTPTRSTRRSCSCRSPR